MDTDLYLRSSCKRWVRLSALVVAVERCLEATARLDAHQEGKRVVELTTIIDVNNKIALAERSVDHELDRLTSELLIADYRRRIQLPISVAS